MFSACDQVCSNTLQRDFVKKKKKLSIQRHLWHELTSFSDQFNITPLYNTIKCASPGESSLRAFQIITDDRTLWELRGVKPPQCRHHLCNLVAKPIGL